MKSSSEPGRNKSNLWRYGRVELKEGQRGTLITRLRYDQVTSTFLSRVPCRRLREPAC